MPDFDVVILGDGIVARSLALSCQNLRISAVRIAPREPAYENDPRSYALTPECVKFLSEAGLDIPDQDIVTKIEFGFGERLDVPLITIDKNMPLMQMIDHQSLAIALDQNLDQSAHINDHCGSILQKDLGIELPDHDIRAKLLIIAEGKQAPSAKSLGISYQTEPYEQRALTAKLTCEYPHNQTARQLFTAFGPIGILPHDTHDISIVWSQDNARAEWLLALNEEDFVAELEKLISPIYGKLQAKTKASAFPLFHSSPSRLYGERFVLIGDSAHVIHPMMGQGLNLGLRDVMALTTLLSSQKRLGLEIGSGTLPHDFAKARRGDIEKLGLVTKGLHIFGRSQNPIIDSVRKLASQSKLSQMISGLMLS